MDHAKECGYDPDVPTVDVATLAPDQCGWSALALAVVALAALAAYAGPANVWGVIGIGFSLLLLACAASLTWHWQGPAWLRPDGH